MGDWSGLLQRQSSMLEQQSSQPGSGLGSGTPRPHGFVGSSVGIAAQPLSGQPLSGGQPQPPLSGKPALKNVVRAAGLSKKLQPPEPEKRTRVAIPAGYTTATVPQIVKELEATYEQKVSELTGVIEKLKSRKVALDAAHDWLRGAEQLKLLKASKRIEAIDHLSILRSRTGHCTDEEFREALAEYRELMAKQAKMVRRETELHTSVETVSRQCKEMPKEIVDVGSRLAQKEVTYRRLQLSMQLRILKANMSEKDTFLLSLAKSAGSGTTEALLSAIGAYRTMRSQVVKHRVELPRHVEALRMAHAEKASLERTRAQLAKSLAAMRRLQSEPQRAFETIEPELTAIRREVGALSKTLQKAADDQVLWVDVRELECELENRRLEVHSLQSLIESMRRTADPADQVAIARTASMAVGGDLPAQTPAEGADGARRRRAPTDDGSDRGRTPADPDGSEEPSAGAALPTPLRSRSVVAFMLPSPRGKTPPSPAGGGHET